MDSRLLEYYNRELQYIREMGAEFAETYPRIAARLGMDQCRSVRQSRPSRFSRRGCSSSSTTPGVCSTCSRWSTRSTWPVPSCAIVELSRRCREQPQDGVRVGRGTVRRSRWPVSKPPSSARQDVMLWPLGDRVKYVVGTSSL